jgi:hypothetical protein
MTDCTTRFIIKENNILQESNIITTYIYNKIFNTAEIGFKGVISP